MVDPSLTPVGKSVALQEPTASDNPERIFGQWFEMAGSLFPDRSAAAFATVSGDGRPSCRMVLAKGWKPDGIHLFTHYQSRKGRHLEHNPWAALTYYWPQAGAQIRVEGQTARLSPDVSDDYFATRPRASQLSARASSQSQPLAQFSDLVARHEQETRAHQDQDVPRPDFWGGYLLTPTYVEFWREGEIPRLHRRYTYSRATPSHRWRFELLQP